MNCKKCSMIVLYFLIAATTQAAPVVDKNYEQARWDPIHFPPAIDKATDEQCLGCHQEVLERRPLAQSPAGLQASTAKAWYQTLDTYSGDQDTFHRRHLVTPLAKSLMNMRCTTCHQGNDPREEAPAPSQTGDAGFTLRKMVNPKTCLMCHGQFGYEKMGLPGTWSKVRETFGNNCLTCHAAIRTARHQVNFLNPEAIEEAGQKSSDSCFGCHGGRTWYRISYPYPRHPWKGMPKDTPEWAKDRPTESEARFLTK